MRSQAFYSFCIVATAAIGVAYGWNWRAAYDSQQAAEIAADIGAFDEFGGTGKLPNHAPIDCHKWRDDTMQCWAHDAGYPVFYDAGGIWLYDGQVFSTQRGLDAWMRYAADGGR